MKRLATVESVIEADKDDFRHTTYAEVHLRTMGHSRLTPRGVTFADRTHGSVRASHGDRITVILETERDAETIKKLLRIAEEVENDDDNDLRNSPFDCDTICNVHYR